MFEKFTERARKAIRLSRQEAQRLRHEDISTEHLLLGILHEGSGVAAKVLKHFNIDLKRVRQEVEKLLPPEGPGEIALGQLPFSPRAKRTIELAGEAAMMLGHDVIGTEHLLLGLIQEQEGIAARVLASLNLNFETTRETVLSVLTQGPSDPPAPKPEASIIESNLFDRARDYVALADRPELQESIATLLQQGRSIAIIGPKYVGKTSLVFALTKAKARRFRNVDTGFR